MSESEALEFWQRRSRRQLNEADARRIGSNLMGVFELLSEWELKRRRRDQARRVLFMETMETIILPEHPEMGRELAVSELRIGQTVVAWAEHRPEAAVRLEVVSVTDGLLRLSAGDEIFVLLTRRPDDTAVDQLGYRVHIFKHRPV